MSHALIARFRVKSVPNNLVKLVTAVHRQSSTVGMLSKGRKPEPANVVIVRARHTPVQAQHPCAVRTTRIADREKGTRLVPVKVNQDIEIRPGWYRGGQVLPRCTII